MAFGRRDDVTIRYGADDSRFRKVTKRVKAAGKDLSGFFGGIGQAIGNVFSRTLAGGLAGVSAALAGVTKSALNTADALAKTADKVGVSIENLQRLRYAADASGVSQNTLDMALQRFSRRIGEAARGTGVLHKELVELGIPLRDAQGNMRTNEAILLDYADAVANAESAQEQLRLSFVGFDSEGAALVNVMRQGRVGMLELMSVADELGLVLDENTVRASERLNQAWDDMTSRWSAYWKKTILDMATTVDRLAGNYRTLADAEERLIELNELLDQTEKDKAKSAGFTAGLFDYRIRKIKEEIAALNEKRDALDDVDRAEKSAAARAGTQAAPKGKPKKTGVKASGKIAEKTASEQLVENRLARQRKDITQDEYRQRRSEIILGSDPAGDLAKVKPANYGPVESSLTLKPTISPEFTKEIEKAVNAALNGKTYTVKVQPEIVGYTGGDAIEDAATEEGERQ